ncbi:MAG: dienelactone hydrolase family protein [Cytophagales bacterium]|nr:dienelactone hydrolase family protein [Cytophagales bacterium]
MLTQEFVTDTQGLLNAQSGKSSGLSRRVAMQAAIGVGYAAAAAPLMAQTAIKTSSEGLTVGEVVIDAQGFKMNAYRAAPSGSTNLPIILVVQEIFGVHEYIADTCRRFAKLGYLAIAPELYQRQGDASSYNSMADLQRELVAKVGDAQVMGDLDACVAWASANGGDAKRVGITGFCWGGRITWLYAAHSKAVRAAVAWYGRLVGTPSGLFPKHPIDLVDQLNAPVLGLYGEADTGIPMENVALMQSKLQSASNASAKASTFVTYLDTPHAFHADYRASYRKAAAEDGWRRALAWFKQHGC